MIKNPNMKIMFDSFHAISLAMKDGQFTVPELKLIKESCEIVLNATNKVLSKAEEALK
jgi:hypothetical protein